MSRMQHLRENGRKRLWPTGRESRVSFECYFIQVNKVVIVSELRFCSTFTTNQVVTFQLLKILSAASVLLSASLFFLQKKRLENFLNEHFMVTKESGLSGALL